MPELPELALGTIEEAAAMVSRPPREPPVRASLDELRGELAWAREHLAAFMVAREEATLRQLDESLQEAWDALSEAVRALDLWSASS